MEPHTDTRELYDMGLTAAGFDVVTAHDAALAMIAFTTHTPTIVVSETRLPGGSDMLTRFAAMGVPVSGCSVTCCGGSGRSRSRLVRRPRRLLAKERPRPWRGVGKMFPKPGGPIGFASTCRALTRLGRWTSVRRRNLDARGVDRCI